MDYLRERDIRGDKWKETNSKLGGKYEIRNMFVTEEE